MAQLVISAAGAAIGFAVGGPVGAQIGWAVGSAVGASINRPKVQGPRLEDLKVGSSQYGTPIPRTYGSPRVPGQIWWASDKREISTTTSAGKGGGPEVTNYSYEVDLLIGLADNAIDGVTRIWQNGKLIYCNLSTSDYATWSASVNTNAWTRLTVYDGAADQQPDAVYEAAVGADLAAAYRGRGCVFIEGLQLGTSGQLPNLTFEIGAGDFANVQYLGAITTTSLGTNLPAHAAGDLIVAVNSSGTNPPAQNVAFTTVGVYGSGSSWWRVSYLIDADNSFISSSGFGSQNTTFFVFSNALQIGQVGFSQASTVDQIAMPSVVADEPSAWLHVANAAPLATEANHTWQVAPEYEYKEDPNVATSSRISGLWLSTSLQSPNNTAEYISNVAMTAITMQIVPALNGSGAASTKTLQATVEELMQAAGMQAWQYDAADLSAQDVKALAITQPAAVRTTLEQLAAAYFFECTLRDKIYLRPRAEDPVDSVPFADLAAAADAAAAEPLMLTVANDLEQPPQVAVAYANLLDDHQQGTEYSDRMISGQAATQTVQLALGLTPAEAKGVADAIVVDAAASRTTTTMALPLEYAHLEAGDVVTVLDEDATSYRMRLVRKRDEAGVLTFDAVADDQTALISLQVTDETQAPSGSVTTSSGTLFEPLDIPILRDADDSPGWYVAAKGISTNWPGAQIQASVDDVTFVTAAEVNESAVYGSCSTVLGDYTGVGFDEINSVTLDVGNGELSSSTRDAMLADATINAMLVGSEIIRFRTATLSSPGVYVLSGLLRGQRGTEWAMAGHGASELAVLLRPQGLRRVTTQSTEIERARYLRGVTLGTVASDATSEIFTDTGVALKPWAPVDLRAQRDQGNALVLSWKRRTRLAARFTGAAGILVPLGEASESYEVDILDGATVVRTISTTTAQAVYDATQQQADFGQVQSSVSVKVYQLSATVGRGYPLEDAAAGSDSDFTAAAQLNTITFGGTFAPGIYVSALYQSGGGSGLLGQHYTVSGDANLGGVAEALAAAINASTGTTGFSATVESPQDAVIVSGPVGVPFVLSVQFAALSAINAIRTQEAAYASPGTAYLAYVSLVNLLTGVVEPVPAGTTFTLRFERPIDTITDTITYTTSGSTTALTVCAGLATAFDQSAILTSSGYSVFVNSQGASARLAVYGPIGLTNIYLAGNATGGYGLTVSQQTVAQPAYATDQVQQVEVTISGTPAIGEEFWVTLAGVEYAFTAASTYTSDVATELAAAINAETESPTPYTAVAVGSVVTVSGVSPAQVFGYDRGVRTLITATIT
jgi:hypothetical protein